MKGHLVYMCIDRDDPASKIYDIVGVLQQYDDMKQFGVMSSTADKRVSISKWCFSICGFGRCFFFLTKIVEKYSS